MLATQQMSLYQNPQHIVQRQTHLAFNWVWSSNWRLCCFSQGSFKGTLNSPQQCYLSQSKIEGSSSQTSLLNRCLVTPVHTLPILSLPSPPDLPSPPAPTNPNHSPMPSFELWDGIEPQPQDIQPPWAPQPQDFQPPWSPPQPLSHLGSLLPFFHPPPSNPPMAHISPLLAPQNVEEHEFSCYMGICPPLPPLLLAVMEDTILFLFVLSKISLTSYWMQLHLIMKDRCLYVLRKTTIFICHKRCLCCICHDGFFLVHNQDAILFGWYHFMWST